MGVTELGTTEPLNSRSSSKEICTKRGGGDKRDRAQNIFLMNLTSSQGKT